MTIAGASDSSGDLNRNGDRDPDRMQLDRPARLEYLDRTRGQLDRTLGRTMFLPRTVRSLRLRGMWPGRRWPRSRKHQPIGTRHR